MFDPPVKLTLDRERELKWTMRAQARLGRLPEPPPLSDLFSRNPHRAVYTLCAWLWAAIDDPADEFAKPEDLAEYLKEEAAQARAAATLVLALRQAGVLKAEKKTVTPAPPPAGSSASSGRTPSSSSARPARRSSK